MWDKEGLDDDVTGRAPGRLPWSYVDVDEIHLQKKVGELCEVCVGEEACVCVGEHGKSVMCVCVVGSGLRCVCVCGGGGECVVYLYTKQNKFILLTLLNRMAMIK